jgi:putative ABC transport system permease protein
MKTILLLAMKSLRNRFITVALTVLSISLSLTLLLGVERVRTESHHSFTNTIAGVDLLVGARSGPIQLLLYAVFHIGHATNNLSWQSYEEIKALPEVQWTIPISLGDSHRGYRVVGTTPAFFDHFTYGARQPLRIERGDPFDDLYDAVIGAETARRLGYEVGDTLVIAHGAGEVSFIEHGDKPFTVAGILAPTGTPVDRAVYVSLEAIEAIHIDWRGGAPLPGVSISADQARRLDLTPRVITAFMVKLKSPIATFTVQRFINQYPAEPLTAILPGVALQQLWELIGVAEKALFAVSIFVVVVGLSGMLTALLTSLNERRREMAILRSVGARPIHIFGLMIGEAVLVTSMGIALGVALLYLMFIIAQPLLLSRLGLYLGISMISPFEWLLIVLVWLAGLLVGIIPAWRIYRLALMDGLSVRI